jgi:class 3 adenylate cyclase/tetratricopeptide (TPR) repeat protein
MVTCPSCGKENPEGFAFCGFCTAPLEQALAQSEERKVVTILFCDLVGFTKASDRADPEDVRARIRPYHERLREELDRYGGTVEKFIGDAVMAIFGAPVAHEDDAERAVRAALRLLEAIDDLNAADPELDLSVRIGINTGEAVVALGARPEAGEGLVTGDVVNTASRLQSAAPVGGIAVGEATYRATSRGFDYEELESVSVKGKTEPLLIWRARQARARFGTDITRAHATALVGRELERTMLASTFERSVRDSSVQLVTIVGEPGVGKSRLVAELWSFIDDYPDLVRWRQGRCLPYGEGITFWALGEIVKAEAGILESDSLETATLKLDRAVSADEQDREWLKARLAPLVGLESGSSAERDESFTGWRRFLEQMAASNPTVLVIEDLHWADPAMLEFLEHVTDWSEGVPMLLVCTARPELYERHSGWAGGKRNANTINLGPLTDAETAQLISALLDRAVLPAEVQSLILERAGGNPLYAEEYVRMLRDRGLVTHKGRSVALAEGEEIPFPDSIQALVAARLDTLPPDRKQILQDASVVGKVFWSAAVASMQDLDERAVTDALHELSRKELVRPARVSSMEGETEYAFWHLLVRDVAYSQIPRAAKAARHEAVAGWIERRAGERVEDHAEILSHHYTQALELARAAGQTDRLGKLEASALRFLVLAGDRGLALDVAGAERSYSRALELAPPGHPERADILVRWAEALRQRQRSTEARSALEEAVADFRGRGDTLRAATTLSLLGLVIHRQADRRGSELIAESVAMLEAEPPGKELVDVYLAAAGHSYVVGENALTVSLSERALAVARDLGLPEPAMALGTLGGARWYLGDRSGLDDMQRGLAMVIEQGSGRDAGVLYNNIGVLLWPTEGPAKGLEVLRAGAAFAERRGMEEFVVATSLTSLLLLIDLGSWDEAFELAETMAERLKSVESALDELEAMIAMADILALRGQIADAARFTEGIAQRARESGEPQFVAAGLPVVALVHLASGDRAGALAILEEIDRSVEGRQEPYYASALPRMLRVAIGVGDAGLAERLLQGIDPVYPMQANGLTSARSLLAEHAGELVEAADAFALAAAAWESFGNVYEHAQALLGHGRCLVALGRATDATAPLHEAREIFARLEAGPALAETDSLLERAIALTS